MDKKTETRGRKALAPEMRKAPQATIKINNTILPFVRELKEKLKDKKVTDKTIKRLFNVLNNKWEQTSTIEKENEQKTIKNLEDEVKQLNQKIIDIHQANAIKPLESTERGKLNEKYHTERAKAIKLESKNNTNRSTIRNLKEKIKILEHLEHDCQAITKTGTRCTKAATNVKDFNGMEMHVCSQHQKNLKDDFKITKKEKYDILRSREGLSNYSFGGMNEEEVKTWIERLHMISSELNNDDKFESGETLKTLALEMDR